MQTEEGHRGRGQEVKIVQDPKFQGDQLDDVMPGLWILELEGDFPEVPGLIGDRWF